MAMEAFEIGGENIRMRKKHILVIEKSDLLREKIAGAISRWKNDVVVSLFVDYSDIEGMVEEIKPDMLILDVRACGEARQMVAGIKRMHPEIKIVVLADESGEEYRRVCYGIADLIVAKFEIGREKSGILGLLEC